MKKKVFNQLHKFVSLTFITASFKQILFSNHKVVKTTFFQINSSGETSSSLLTNL